MVDDFVPSHHFFAVVFAQETADDLHEPRLQVVHAAESFLLNATLAVGVVLPRRRRTFVAADVDVFIRKDLGDMAEHAFQEVDGLVFSDVQNVGADTARNAHAVGFRRVATQFGIGRHDRNHVAGHVDFRDDFDVAFLRVGHDFAQVVERVETAATIFRVVVERGFVGCVVALHRAGADRSDGRQFRIFGNLDSPALVVGQVPVESVEFIDGSHVDEFFHLFLVEEMTAHVEHKTSVGHQRFVGDIDEGQSPIGIGFQVFSVDGRRHQLAKRLQGVEETAEIRRADLDSVAADRQFITFRGTRLVKNHFQIFSRPIYV